MDHRTLILLGTALEIAGTFLLAVEAIKLPNLQFFREKILKVATLKINPVIYFVDKETPETKAGEIWFNTMLVFFIVLGLSIAYAGLRLSGHSLSNAWLRFASIVPGSTWIDILVAIPTTFVLLVLASVVGTTAYTIPVIMLDGAIAVLSFIERHTASGVIGIFGFLFFFVGAAIMSYVSWVSV
nr:hypothetical protein [Bacteroidota bacterium]